MTSYEMKNACLEAGMQYEQCGPAERGKSAVAGWTDDVGTGVAKCYAAAVDGWQQRVSPTMQAMQRMAEVICTAEVEADRLRRRLDDLSGTVQRIAEE